MNKQQQIDLLKSENAALRRNVADYKVRHDFAVTELAELSSGIGVKPSWYAAGHSWDKAMEYKAQLAVIKLLKMPLREAP
jgi:hypothetical protein